MSLGVTYPHPWRYRVITASGLTVVAGNPTGYGGYLILGAAGAHTMDIYDNASAASGQKLANGVSVNSAANVQDDLFCTSGITVNLSGDPTDGLILVRYR